RVRTPREQRADKIGQSLQNIDAHSAGAADVISARAIEGLRNAGFSARRGQPGARRLRQCVDREIVLAGMLEGPQHQRQLRRRRLQEKWEIDVEGTETDAVTAQLCATVLVEGFHFLGNGLALEN